MGVSRFDYESGNEQVQPAEFRRLLTVFTRAAEEYYGDWGVQPKLDLACSNDLQLPENLQYPEDISDDVLQNSRLIFAFVTFAGKQGNEQIVLGLDKANAPKKLKLLWTTPENNQFQYIPVEIQDFARQQGNGSTVKIVPVV